MTLLPNTEMMCSGGLFAVQALDMPLIFQHPPMLLSDKAISIFITEVWCSGIFTSALWIEASSLKDSELRAPKPNIESKTDLNT